MTQPVSKEELERFLDSQPHETVGPVARQTPDAPLGNAAQSTISRALMSKDEPSVQRGERRPDHTSYQQHGARPVQYSSGSGVEKNIPIEPVMTGPRARADIGERNFPASGSATYVRPGAYTPAPAWQPNFDLPRDPSGVEPQGPKDFRFQPDRLEGVTSVAPGSTQDGDDELDVADPVAPYVAGVGQRIAQEHPDAVKRAQAIVDAAKMYGIKLDGSAIKDMAEQRSVGPYLLKANQAKQQGTEAMQGYIDMVRNAMDRFKRK